MPKHLIDFANLSWVEAGIGVRYKIFTSGAQQIRLVEFSEGFVEDDWCLKGHAGYVLEGSCSIDFNGRKEQFEAGGVLFIPQGDDHKHKLIVNQGGSVRMLLFEII